MNIYVYSDESGVFDKVHNSVYVFGGVIFLSKEQKDDCLHKYKHAEDVVRIHGSYAKGIEIKANTVKPKQKYSLFRSLNQYHKFAAVVYEKKVEDRIFDNKKSKQRYLDYVYKIALKNAFLKLIENGIILPEQVENIFIYADEHTTATNGRYELKEALEQEFKIGTINFKYNCFYEPIFKDLNSVQLQFCNSESNTLIRAADIIANNFFHLADTSAKFKILSKENTYIKYFP